MKEPRAIILDAGPLVALANEDDNRHEICVRTMKKLSGSVAVYTVASVLAEALWLLPQGKHSVDSVFNSLSLLGCQIVSFDSQDLLGAQELLKKYADLPMDFADCEICLAAEKLKIDTIFTLDKRDFSIYRPSHAKSFRLIPD
ncbi:MAG: PIN domain-containing protein [Candidatus Obscuribacterales bacterium]|nr:PIN domain-containing protein [Candidatus Obscuribacterales bacterium]